MWDFRQFSGCIAAVDESGRALYYEELEEENQRFKERLGGRSLVFVLYSNTMGDDGIYMSCLNVGSVPLLLFGVKGIDRVVEIGFVWDGMDLGKG